MKPAPFQLHRATTVADAVDLLARLGADGAEAKIVSGGQSLVPMMNFRLARPDHLVDISGVAELRSVTVDGDGCAVIGAGVTQADALTSSVVRDRVPMLAEAIAHIGHGHIRTRGTVGGSVAHADPAAELPSALVALDATIEIAGPNGRRSCSAEAFFEGWFTTSLTPDELVTAIRVPPHGVDVAGTEWGFEELARRQGDFAMVLAASVLRRDEAGAVIEARVVLGGVGATPIRASSVERAVIGATTTAELAEAASLAVADCSPADDVHADAAYRRDVAAVLVARALDPAVDGLRDVDLAPIATSASVPDREPPTRPIETAVVVNGTERSIDHVADRRLLADYLRDELALTGTHLGCEHGVCGACTVLVDEEPVRSCLLFAKQAAGSAVTTIEALGAPDSLHPVQEAFRAKHGLQCGFCTPGMVLATVDLLRRSPDPTDDEIRHALSGNLCRCTGYVKIIESVRAAAAALSRTARS